MSDEKVYVPEVIVENPYPSGAEVSPTTQTSQGGTADILAPTNTTDKVFPIKRRAVELLSNALNTRSRKILQEFELAQSGGIQIGNFQEGITGDLRLTPNGMTGRDIAGNTTFDIDSLTGDAVFKGEVLAGSFLAVDEEGNYVTVDGERILTHDGATDKDVVLIGKF